LLFKEITLIIKWVNYSYSRGWATFALFYMYFTRQNILLCTLLNYIIKSIFFLQKSKYFEVHTTYIGKLSNSFAYVAPACSMISDQYMSFDSSKKLCNTPKHTSKSTMTFILELNVIQEMPISWQSH